MKIIAAFPILATALAVSACDPYYGTGSAQPYPQGPRGYPPQGYPPQQGYPPYPDQGHPPQ